MSYTRKNPNVPLVEFESSLFEGVFKLPDLTNVPVGVVVKLQDGDIGALTDWIADTPNVDPAAVEAILSLSARELRDFQEEWGNASAVELPKSQD